MQEPQPVAPLPAAQMAFSVPAACKVAGVGRTKLYEAIQSGALRARKNGAKNLILRDDLQQWLESLPTEKVIIPSTKRP
ncbi:helix-turn-helix domain-containing protein [Bradyrhizobium sp. F1.13.3]|uniref:helix-turn-helix domain-containing protein n=1 Tax=Bradyrhizobium sp. F1.13.3 TaxID=3156351 RepID=UPI003397CC6E